MARSASAVSAGSACGNMKFLPSLSTGTLSFSTYCVASRSSVQLVPVNCCGRRRALNRSSQVGSVSAYQVLVVNRPSSPYQNTACFERPMGRIAPRSLRLTESARERGSAAMSQSMSVVPRKRKGDAPTPLLPIMGCVRSFTPALLRTMPVCRGKRPDMVLACPGAVSVVA